MDYSAATADQVLAIRVNAGIAEIAAHARFAAASPDMVEAIVEGIGQFAAGEWAPLNRKGDQEGAKLANGVVSLPDGFAAAYHHYVEQGWNAIAGDPAFGGQGMPFTLSANVIENLGSAARWSAGPPSPPGRFARQAEAATPRSVRRARTLRPASTLAHQRWRAARPAPHPPHGRSTD